MMQRIPAAVLALVDAVGAGAGAGGAGACQRVSARVSACQLHS